MTDTTHSVVEREEYSPVDGDLHRAFIDGWNARLDHTDFDMALHYWMLRDARPLVSAPTTEQHRLAPAPEQGWWIAPIEPTEEMVAAGARAALESVDEEDLRIIWDIMRAASPSSPSEKSE